MPILETFIAFFTSEAMITFAKQFSREYVAEKTVDKILSFAKSKFNNNSFEYQLILLLDETLENTCNYFGWEYDANAMTETFITEWQNLNAVTSESGLKSILHQAIGYENSENVYHYWIECFYKNVSNPKYQWVYNYINNNINYKNGEFHEHSIVPQDGISFYRDKYQEALFLHKHLDEKHQICLKDIFIFPSCFIINPKCNKPNEDREDEIDKLDIQEVLKFYFHQRPKNSSETFYEMMFLEGQPALGKSSLISNIAWNSFYETDFAQELLGTRKLLIVRMLDILSDKNGFIDLEQPMRTFFSHLHGGQLDADLLTKMYKQDGRTFFENSVLILDGFDELCMVDEVLRDHGTIIFTNMYHELRKMNCNCKIVITTRPHYIQTEKLDFPLIYVEILPFDSNKRAIWLEKYNTKYQIESKLCAQIEQEQPEQMEYLLQIPLVLYMVAAKNIEIGNGENLWHLYYKIFHEEVYIRNYENLDSHITALHRSDLYALTSNIAYVLCEERCLYSSVENLLKKQTIKEIISRMDITNSSGELSTERLKEVLENCVVLTSYFNVQIDKHNIEFCHNNIKDFFCCEYLWVKRSQLYESIPENQQDWENYFIKFYQNIFQYTSFMKDDNSKGSTNMVITFFREKIIYYKENGFESFAMREMEYKYFENFFGKMMQTGMLYDYQLEKENNIFIMIANIYTSVLAIYKSIYSTYLEKGERLVIANDIKQKIIIGTSHIYSILFCLASFHDHTYIEFDGIMFSMLKFPNWDFSFSSFKQCLMRYTNFNKCNLQGADFTGAILDYSDFREATINDETCFINCSCEKAKVTREQVKFFEKYGMRDLDIYD